MTFHGTLLGFALSISLFFAHSALAFTDAVPALSNNGNVTLSWSHGACTSGSTYRVNISKQVGTQSVAVTTVNEPVFEYKLTNLANGNYQYNLQYCWTHPTSGFCSPWTPITFTVDRSAPAAVISDFSAKPSTGNPNSIDLSWQNSLYNTYLGVKDTSISFTRDGDPKRYSVLNRTGECGPANKTTVTDLPSGNYQFFLDICGRATKTTSTKTCLSTKVASLSLSGSSLDVGESPQPVPSHQNIFNLPYQNIDFAETLTATTAGVFSVANGTATYAVPIKLPPAAAALMPGLALQYSSNKGNVNDDIAPAGFGWNITGLTSITGCESGHIKDCQKKLSIKETFIKTTTVQNKWFQPGGLTRLSDPSGTQYVYGENGVGQGASTKQLSKVQDVYGNSATVHYRPDGRVGFIYFNSQDAVIFEYSGGYVHAITTYVEAPLSNPASGQVVSRYELTRVQSAVTENQLVQSIRECGFNDSGTKACAKPLVFSWTQGRLGFDSVVHSNSCPSGTQSISVTGDLDDDGYGDSFHWGSIYWGDSKQGCGKLQSVNGALGPIDELGRDVKSSVLRTQDGKMLLHNMKLYRPSKTLGATLVTTLFVVPGSPSIAAIIDDFNADGLDDVYYGGGYWHQNPTSPPSFNWNGTSPNFNVITGVPNTTYEVSEYTHTRAVILGYVKPRDVNGDGKIDKINEIPNFDIGIDSYDYNKDGRTDAFFIKDGDFVFDLNLKNGNQFARAGRPFSAFNGIGSTWATEPLASSEISKGGWPWNLFPGDWTGDGVPDAFLAKANGIYAGLRGKPDLLQSITDGFGAKTTIDYDTLHGDLVDGKVFYSPASVKPTWPHEHTYRGMDVVKKVGQSNGVGGYTHQQYYYQGGLYNTVKREFMGFEKVTRVLPEQGLVENTYYNQKIPFNGTVAKSESKTVDGRWINRVTNHYVAHAENSRYAYNDYSIAEQFSLQSQPVSVVKITNNFDRYGALLMSESVTGTGLSGTSVTGILRRTLTENTPEHDPSRWLLGFIAQSMSTTENGDGTDQRSYTHEYVREPNTVDVQQSILYAGTDVEVTTTYIRDQRSGANQGVVTETIVSARDDVSPASSERSGWFGAFENGVYPTEAYNALGHKTSLGYDKRFAAVNYTRDANALESSSMFDPLGRSVRTVAPTGVVTTIDSYFCEGSPYVCPANGAYVTVTRSTPPTGGGLVTPDTVNFYDSLQRVIRTQTHSMNNAWIKVDTVYDDLGRLSKVSEPYMGMNGLAPIYTEYSNYNALGEALRVRRPDDSVSETVHTLSNSLYVTTVTSTVMGSYSNQFQTQTTKVNALGEAHEVTDSGGTPIHYFYNSQGLLIGTRVNNDEATRVSMDYDSAGNKIWMQDPATGRIDYVYNGFGETRRQIWQINTVNQKSMRFDFDSLGRQIQRVDTAANGSVATSSWRYDVDYLGTLYSETSANGWSRIYTYDALTRLSSNRENYGDGVKTTSFTYDNFGRPATVTYPNGSIITNAYSLRGIHYQTLDTTNGQNKLLWQLFDTVDRRGNYLYSKLGNGVVTKLAFDPVNGQLQSIVSGKDTNGFAAVVGTLQHLQYRWDTFGNLQDRLTTRANSSGSQMEFITEDFRYDASNRLQSAATSGAGIVPRTREYRYDGYGNLVRNGSGTQEYARINGASIYGVTRANNKDYRYDAYGNVVSRGADTIEYNVFNKPTRVGNTQFWYDANHQKVKQQTGNRITYFYAGGAYEVENNSGTLSTVLRVGSYVQKRIGTAPVSEEYHLYDHLGSTDVITDANGNQITRMAFDPFGNRLQDGFASNDSTAIGSVSYKGYTGHDMLDHLGLIHMGGRVYDPDAGRFLSADIFVQAPSNSQSYNRYSYVLNNPLSLIDPSGYASELTADKSPPEEVIVIGYRPEPPLGVSSEDHMWITRFLGSKHIEGVGVTYVYGSYRRAQSPLGESINATYRAMAESQRLGYKRAQQEKMRAQLNGLGLSLGRREAIDVGKAVETLNKNAGLTSKGLCAMYVRLALEAGGADLSVRPTAAKDYGPTLEKLGFEEMDLAAYSPLKGDVVVLQPPTLNKYGHIQMYNGERWVSDFFQRPTDIYPGPSYRSQKVAYEIYRP